LLLVTCIVLGGYSQVKAASVHGIYLVNGSPTTATNLYYTVAFNNAMTNVPTSAFSVTTTGTITGATVVSATVVDAPSNENYLVLVTITGGSGNVTLNVPGTGSSPALTPYTGSTYYTVGTPPPFVNSLKIDGGAQYTNSTTAVLTSDVIGTAPMQMRVSLDQANWEAWHAYSTTYNYNSLSATNGLQFVYVQYQDAAGQITTTYASITLDTQAPTVNILTHPPQPTNNSTVTFTFDANESTIQSYQVSFDGGGYITITSPVTFAGLSQGAHTFAFRAIDLAGNTGAPTNYTLNLDQTPPKISTITAPSATYHIGQTITFTANMTENVYSDGAGGSNLPYLDITVGGVARKATYISGSGASTWKFQYTVQAGDNAPSGITIGTVQSNGNNLTDLPGNAFSNTVNTAPNGSGVIINGIQPTVNITGPTISNLANISFTVTFSENVTGVDASDFQLSGIPGASITSVSPNASTTTKTFIVVVAIPANSKGSLVLTLPANAVTGASGNTNAAGSITVDYDNTPAVVQSVSVPANGYYHAGQTMFFTVNYDKAITVSGGTSSAYLPVTIGSHAVDAVYVSGSGSTALIFAYPVQVGDNDNDGITPGSAINAGSAFFRDSYLNSANLNLNNVANTTLVRVNTTTPTVTLTSTAPATVNGPITVTAVFSEAVTGFTTAGINRTNCTVSNLQTSDNITFTFTATPTADGPFYVNILANAVTNIGGNPNTASLSLTRNADITAPHVTSVTLPADGYYHLNDHLTIMVTFSEPVITSTTQVPQIQMALNTGVVAAVYLSGSGTNTLTFDYKVVNGDMDMDGINVNTAIDPSITDTANNAMNPGLGTLPNTSDIRVSTQIPTVTLTTTVTQTINHPFTVTAKFSEAVTGFDVTGFNITNGTASDLQTTDNITYTATISPNADGQVIVNVKDSAAQNTGLNYNTASGAVTVNEDLTAPAITQVTLPAAGYYVTNNHADFIVQFSEPVVVDATNGTPYMAVNLDNGVEPALYLSGSGTNTLTFRYTVQQGDEAPNGVSLGAAISTAGGTLTDVAGNYQVLAINPIPDASGIKVHTAVPTVTLTSPAVSPVNSGFTVTATFSEAMTGVDITDFTVGNGTPSAFVAVNATTYTFVVTPTADGNVTINLPANSAVNIANTGNTAATQLSVIADVTPPAIINTIVPAPGYYKAGTTFMFNATFGEIVNVTGTPRIPITIGTSTVYANYVSGSGTSQLTFSYTVVNGDTDADGITLANAIDLNSGTIKDIAGNDAILTLNAPPTSQVYVKTIAPVITGVTAPANGYYNAGRVLSFNVTYNDFVSVAGTPTLPVTIGTQTVQANYISGTGSNILTFTYQVADGDMDLDGVSVGAALNLSGGIIADIANNNANLTLNNVASTSGVLVNTNHPTVTLSYTGASRVNQPANITAVFSEAVTGLTTGAFTVINGTASALQTTDNITYTLTVAPSADGVVSVTLPANAAMSVAQNGNTASNTISNITADLTAPVINAGQTFNIDEYSLNTSVVGTPAVTEASGVLQNWIITNDPSGAFAIDATTGVITVHDEAKLNSHVSQTIPVTLTVTDGLNASVPVKVNITIVYVPLPPTVVNLDNQTVSEGAPANTLIGTLSAVTEEPNPVYTYSITGGDVAAFIISGNQLLTRGTLVYAVKNTYTVTIRVTLQNGLFTENTFTINVSQVNQAPTLDAIADQTSCDVTTTQTLQTTGASAVEPAQTLSYAITADQPFFNQLSIDGNGLISYSLKPDVSGLVNLTVTVKDKGGTTNGGVDTLRRSFTLTVNALPVVSITADQDTVVSKGAVVNLTATGGVNYAWDNAADIISGQQTATLQIKAEENNVYNVTVTDAFGCISTGNINISVVEDFKVDATNLLTPNGDGKNDKWIIHNLESYPNNMVIVYDRAGRVVFQQRNYSNDWTGTLNGQPLGEGVYYYVITIQGTNKVAKGAITIIRDQRP
jgi:large repetitive protein